MDRPLSSQLQIWENVEDCEIIPGDQIEQTLSRTTRQVPCLLKPGSIDSLRKIVDIARTKAIPIYPISCGKNWGYGAHLPVEDENVVVSLERFKKIGPCEPHAGKIYIEPGVTQIELYNYLEKYHPQYTYNVTGAGSDTSVIGNSLERGIGYYRSRTEDFHGLKVLTSTGSILQPDDTLWKPWYPLGIGPGWDGLFFQSNLGIVLGGWFSIIPKQEENSFLSVFNGDLVILVDDLKKLYENNLISTVTHIGDPSRKEYVLDGLIQKRFPDLPIDDRKSLIQEFASSDYTGLCAIHGRKRINKAAIKEIKATVSSTTKVLALTQKRISIFSNVLGALPIKRAKLYRVFLESYRGLLELCEGVPTNIGHLGLQKDGDDPNYFHDSAYYLNATLPPSAKETRTLLRILGNCPLKLSTTFIMMGGGTLSAIITLHFKPDEADEAKKQLQILTKVLVDHGFPPYRAGIDQMSSIHFSDTAKALKKALDPAGIIAPGRYS